jgi:hypothetical protein
MFLLTGLRTIEYFGYYLYFTPKKLLNKKALPMKELNAQYSAIMGVINMTFNDHKKDGNLTATTVIGEIDGTQIQVIATNEEAFLIKDHGNTNVCLSLDKKSPIKNLLDSLPDFLNKHESLSLDNSEDKETLRKALRDFITHRLT